MNDKENYESSSFLSKVPVSLLKENITTQFKDPENFRIDYVSSFIDSFNYSIGSIEDSDEEEELLTLHDDFIEFMESMIYEKLGVGIEGLEELSRQDQEDLILFTYRFFIINIRKNFFNLFFNYIKEHKEELLANAKRYKDVTSQAFKKEISEEDTAILANLSEFMDCAIQDGRLTIDDFFRYCEGDKSCVETMFVTKAFDDFTLTGNFIKTYAKLVRPTMRIRIEAEIRNNILKKYREAAPELSESQLED